MEWTEVSICTTTEGIEPVTAALLDCGITGIQVEDDSEMLQFFSQKSDSWDYVEESLINKPVGETKLKVYISENAYGYEILMHIKESMERLKNMQLGMDLGRLAVETVENLNDEVWLNKWKEYYKPFCIGEKIFIKPVWDDAKAPEGRAVFNINPGQVFGTGLHQTTQLCIIQLEKYINENSVVADLGCGSGILSIIALLLGAKSAFAVDIDANAVDTAYENAKLSNVDVSKYYVTSGNVINDKELQDEIGYDKYDVVVANIIADVICAMSPVVPKQLKKGGVFISSGIIKDRLEDVYAALNEVGLKVVETNFKDEWVSVTAVKE